MAYIDYKFKWIRETADTVSCCMSFYTGIYNEQDQYQRTQKLYEKEYWLQPDQDFVQQGNQILLDEANQLGYEPIEEQLYSV